MKNKIMKALKIMFYVIVFMIIFMIVFMIVFAVKAKQPPSVKRCGYPFYLLC